VSAGIRRSSAARLDLLQIFLYIGEQNMDVARRFLTAAEADFRSLARMPGMGALREFNRQKYPGLRSWPVKGFESYLIFHQPTPTGIHVLRVIHGSRDYAQFFEQQEDT
jgi:toxin ParE1/3/4